jgi:hypothetical protein
MKKFILNLLSLALVFTVGMQSANADSVMLPDGAIVKGKIVTVLSGLIEIKTDRGLKKVSREVAVGEARDIVEYGFLIRKRLMGEVFFVNNSTLEITTPTGNLSMNRLWVRDIILSQQIPLGAAPRY